MHDQTGDVLVVDDDRDIVELIAFLLGTIGCRVTMAMNGRQALDVVASKMPDLILLDLKMPIMDGPTFAAELRRRYPSPPPIVVVTAADDARKRAAEIAAAAWIAKPFEPAVLLRAVADHLARAAPAP